MNIFDWLFRAPAELEAKFDAQLERDIRDRQERDRFLERNDKHWTEKLDRLFSDKFGSKDIHPGGRGG